MFTVTHAAVGWLLAEAGGGNRGFRRAVFLSAVLPDLDGVTLFVAPSLYSGYHHVWTHNLLSSLLVSAAAVLLCRGFRLRVLLFTQFGFYTHYFGDYFLTQWPQEYLFPFSRASFGFHRAMPLYHPVNYFLLYASLAALVAVMLWRRRTPLDMLRGERHCPSVTSGS